LKPPPEARRGASLQIDTGRRSPGWKGQAGNRIATLAIPCRLSLLLRLRGPGG